MVLRSRVIRSALVDTYVHHVPDFRGKWWLLAPLARLLDGTPVRSRYGGVLLGLDVRDRTHQLGLSGKYGVVVSGEVEKLNPGDCFIDVGANCGVFSLLAAERVGPDGLVVSFEPCFATFAKLVRNIGLNHLDNVLPFNMAIAALSGPDLLDSRSEGHSGRYAIAPEPIETGERIMSLSIRDFPGLMKLIGDRPIVVKIDVEGFEHAVLQGLERVLALPQTRSIVVEIDQRNLSRYGTDPQAVYALLEGHGFSRSDATDSTTHFDAVFHRKAPVAARSEHIARAVHPRHAPRNRAALPTRRANWHHLPQIAAAMMLLAGGWLIGNASFQSGAEQAEENFVEEALQSHNIAQVQTKLRRSPPAIVNPVEVGSLTRIALPILPKGWHVINIQVFPSDSGPSLQMNITNGKNIPISLFAVRDDKVAPSRPDVTTRDGNAIAYWQEGDLAYALISKKSPEELDRLAEDIADNITS